MAVRPQLVEECLKKEVAMAEMFKTIKSKDEPISRSESIELSDYKYAVCYWSDGVEIVSCEEMQLPTSRENAFLLEVRAFDTNKELYLTRLPDGNYIGRVRMDEKGDTELLIYEEYHKVWGDPAKNQVSETNTLLSEDRGIELTLPIEVEKGKTAFIQVRNYFSKEGGDLKLIDWRFVTFKIMEAKPYQDSE